MKNDNRYSFHRNRSLLNRSMIQFTFCVITILILCAPIFYLLTEKFYAEDLADLINSIRRGRIMTNFDLQRDIVVGMMIQYAVIAAVICASVMVTIRLVARKIWKPFDDTLNKIEQFHLGKDPMPELIPTNIKEFERLNKSVTNLIKRDIVSYKDQKEAIENASHELQTPIAIIKSNLDMLLQEDLNEKESQLVQNMYDETSRMGKLFRSLLLLAKIECKQYGDKVIIDVAEIIEKHLPQFEELYSEQILFDVTGSDNRIEANLTLLEILINNLVVNALRHNKRGEAVRIKVSPGLLTVSNMAVDGPLDAENMYTRFNNCKHDSKSNGLGLAIAKQICDFHKWKINYSYIEGYHTFTVDFRQ